MPVSPWTDDSSDASTRALIHRRMVARRTAISAKHSHCPAAARAFFRSTAFGMLPCEALGKGRNIRFEVSLRIAGLGMPDVRDR